MAIDVHAAAHYVPLDRQRALAQQVDLPTSMTGSALYADVSGFTRLTEMMVEVYGARRGAEILPRYLDMIYDTLISQVTRFGGSVIGFSGDAITCWFDGGDSAQRAVTAAWAMQQGVARLDDIQLAGREPLKLGVKIAVASGDVRRFLVGDPRIQVIEVLAGSPISQLYRHAKRAQRGESIIDAHTAEQCRHAAAFDALDDDCWKLSAVSLESAPAAPVSADLSAQQVRPWLLPEVYERLEAGLGEFLTELRPAVPLFAKFTGIDFEQGDASDKLNRYVHDIQHVLERYQGRLIQLTIDDKGSYFYAAFGAPLAHEDDAERATAAALELRRPSFDFIESVQIGISQGLMRVGAYGSDEARTYGVLGDEVNLAARLMEHAGAGEIIGTSRVRKASESAFVWSPLPPVTVKGKRSPVEIARLLNERQIDTSEIEIAARSIQGHVGRGALVDQALDWLKTLQTWRSPGLLLVSGEPGVGKTHFLHVVRQRGGYGHWWVCPPDSILKRSLHPFLSLFRTYFRQTQHDIAATNRARFDERMTDLMALVPHLREPLEHAASFVGALLGLEWEQSDYQLGLPKARFNETLSACQQVLLAMSVSQPMIVQIEDAHLLDADSLELINRLLSDIHDHPLALIVTSRFTEYAGASAHIALERFTPDLVADFAADLLKGALEPDLPRFLHDKTDGNPFFIEQLILSLRESGALLKESDGVWRLQPQLIGEVPVSINGMLVARLDRLKPHLKAVVQGAAVLGSEFNIPLLTAVHGDDAAHSLIEAEREGILQRVDSATYRFEHSLLRDTAYEMQLSSRLREQHAVVARAIEALYPDDYADLAYHYGRAEEADRERHYARLAGEHAASRFANREAIHHLSRALELTEPPRDQMALLRLREAVYDVQGARDAQTRDLDRMRTLIEGLGDDRLWAEYALRRANYAENTGAYGEAVLAGQSVVDVARRIGAPDIEIEGYLIQGRARGWQADYAEAREKLEKAKALAEAANLRWQVANSLRSLGIVAFAQGRYEEARSLQTRALSLCREIGDRRGESMALNSLAVIAREQRQLSDAQSYHDMALKLSVEIGDRRMQASIGAQMVTDLVKDEPYSTRLTLQNEMLTLNRQIKNRRGECTALQNLAAIALESGAVEQARLSFQNSIEVAQSIGYRQGVVKSLLGLAWLYGWMEQFSMTLNYAQGALTMATEIDSQPQVAHAWLLMGQAFTGLGQLPEARQALMTAEHLCRTLKRGDLLPEVLSGLAFIDSRQGALANAQTTIHEALEKIAAAPRWDALKVYWSAYLVYQASGWKNTLDLLEVAHALLHERAAVIDVDELRRAFLDTYPLHADLSAARAWALHER